MPSRPLRCQTPARRVEEGLERIRDRLDVPRGFSADVLEAAEAAARRGPTTPPGASSAVQDRRDLDFVAIDPPGSTDLDQAFHAQRSARGYRVHYAIADVASFVAPGGLVDTEARHRGVTLYSPDTRAPLHPEAISEDAGSLLAGQERRALLWTIELDADGEIDRAVLQRAMVRNRAQLTYRQAQEAIDGTQDHDTSLALLREIGQLRLALEAQRGAVSLQLPSQEIREVNGRYELHYDETLPVESWNAQISLLTGIAASRIMIDSGVGLLRTLPEPDPRTVQRLRRTARALGLNWPDDVGYAERIRDLTPDTARAAALLAQSARGLRGAGYVAFRDSSLPDRTTHSAIASTYAHVTAPLRRLCDRFANEIVMASCAEHEVPAWVLEALDEVPSLMGRATQRDRQLERVQIDFMEALVLEPLVGSTFTGVVTDVDDDGARVQLDEPAVVARLDGADHELGATVEVVLREADPQAAVVRFGLAR